MNAFSPKSASLLSIWKPRTLSSKAASECEKNAFRQLFRWDLLHFYLHQVLPFPRSVAVSECFPVSLAISSAAVVYTLLPSFRTLSASFLSPTSSPLSPSAISKSDSARFIFVTSALTDKRTLFLSAISASVFVRHREVGSCCDLKIFRLLFIVW